MKRIRFDLTFLVIVAVILVAPESAYSNDCKSLRDKVNQGMEKLEGKQRGGVYDTKLADPKYKEPEVVQLQRDIRAMKKSYCRPDPKWMIKNYNKGSMDITPSEIVPSQMGGPKVVDSPSYSPRFDPSLYKSVPEPKKQPKVKDPVPDKEKDESDCGELAIQFIGELRKLKGDDIIKYKDDCAGFDDQLYPRPSPNKSNTVCNGKEYGKFGLIYGSYNNKYVTSVVTDLWFKTPGEAENSSNVVAYNNPAQEKKSDGQCNLSNLRSCGQKGDIIMVQTNPESGPNKPYDYWAIFDGTAYFEASSSGEAIRRVGLRSQFLEMPHEVRRLSCSN